MIFFIFLFLCQFFESGRTLRMNPKGPQIQQEITNCIYKIAVENFRIGNLMGVTSSFSMSSPTAEIEKLVLKKLHATNRWLIEISNDDEDKPQTERKISLLDEDEKESTDKSFYAKRKNDHYVIVLDKLEGFDELKDVFRAPSFNPAANYLIYIHDVKSCEEATTLLRKIWLNYLCLNTILLAPIQYYSSALYIYRLNVFNPAVTCGTNITCQVIGTCQNEKFEPKIIEHHLYDERVPANSFGCTVEATAFTWPPFVINVTAKKDPGMEIYVLQAIAEQLNFSINFVQRPQKFFKAIPWPQILAKGKSYFAIGNIFLTKYIYENFYISTPYFEACVLWFVPLANEVPRWRSLIIIFSKPLWASMLVAVLTITFSWYCFARRSKIEKISLRSLSLCLLDAFCIVFGITNSTRPLSYMVRLVFLLGSIYGLHINSLYQASLLRLYRNPPRQHQISTVEEIITTKLPFGGINTYHDFYNASKESIFANFYKNYYTIDNQSLNFYLELVARKRNFATMANRFFCDYYAARHDDSICTEENCPAVFSLPRPVLCYSMSIVARKGFPFINRVNKIILFMRENGVLLKWSRDMKQNAIKSSGATNKKKQMGLTLAHVQGGFALWLMGSVLAAIVFCIEIITKHFILKINTKKIKK